MENKADKYLFDILESIDSIFEYLGEKRDFIRYRQNKLLRRGVERELEIIGEATNRLLKAGFEIENARRIVDLRNFVIHNYDKVDDVIIWGIISRDLPKLRKELNNLLNNKK